ncbi:Reverse transcriptase zinc-binding domain [Arabidopsis thaliana x Arabidopsis arenosa]|uniref:Reverse transcriptase zinc-binding domain n=1 Tax=Arabidopsis thaliana x Arabidopsis arenosa TaxID=1240361 RepID=A0A8T1XP11_9BRAS|nr:Reverse transcriptase zinc-binding domain [Arabidopsis thaliana x Arabidopsis arenosa]
MSRFDHPLSWGRNCDGAFTVSSAYSLLTRDSAPRQQMGVFYDRIWKVVAPERVRIFLWLVANQAIMTNVERARRHLCDFTICEVCKGAEESILHILRDCPAMLGIWRRLIPHSKWRSFFSQSLLGWMFGNLGEDGEVDESTRSTRYAMAAWWGWKWRCGNVFETEGRNSNRQTVERLIAWVYPRENWLKLNINGASHGNPGLASAGGVLQDSEGNWCGGFAVNLGICSAPLAELWGVYYGLFIAWDHRATRVELEVDSQLVVGFLTTGISESHPLSILVRLCYGFLSKDWIVRISHVYRGANRLADGLANYAFSLPLGFPKFNTMPPCVETISREDFEILTMEESETIEEFSGKISAIASEAHNLGKKYKDKKLVKKLLRCLPSRFESKRTAMGTALDTDTIDFEEVVGMMQTYELEITTGNNSSSKGLVLTVSSEKNEIQELKDEMSMMAKNFNRTLRRVEKKGFVGNQGADIRTEIKVERGQTFSVMSVMDTGISSSSSRKDKSYAAESESDSEDDDSSEDVTGYVAFMGSLEEEDESTDDESVAVNGKSSSESESDVEQDVDVDGALRKLYDNWLLLSNEKISLMEEKLTLRDENEKLEKDLALEVKKNSELMQRCSSEEEKTRVLTLELNDTRKKIHMLNSGTKDLDSILASGRVGKSNFGLGYHGGSTGGTTKFVKSQSAHNVVNHHNHKDVNHHNHNVVNHHNHSAARNNSRLAPARHLHQNYHHRSITV